MRIEKEVDGEKLILRIIGRLETSTAPQLQDIVEKETHNIVNLQIDMQYLEYVSSAGLRVLLSAHKKMKAKNGTMTLHQVNEEVMEVFEITGFNTILDIR